MQIGWVNGSNKVGEGIVGWCRRILKGDVFNGGQENFPSYRFAVYRVWGEDELSDRLDAVEVSYCYCRRGSCAELKRLRAELERVSESRVEASRLAEWGGEVP